VRVVDVQSGHIPDLNRHPVAGVGTSITPSALCTCSWGRNDPILPDLQHVPVVRRFGDHTCGKLGSGKEVAYISPIPRDELVASPSPSIISTFLGVNLQGRLTHVVQFPFPRTLPLAFSKRLSTRSRFDTLVLRRRSEGSEQFDWPREAQIRETARCVVAFLNRFLWDITAFKVIFVDAEANPPQPRESASLPFTETLRAQFKTFALGSDFPRAHRFNMDNLLFMTMDEYRTSIGTEAFELEEDDHGFDFPPDSTE
jgi:hypothetical protein